MEKDYKARKEAFVSNLSGGDINEINTVALVASVSALLWSTLQSRISFFSPYTPKALVADFLLNVVAILFSTTVYSTSPLLLNILLLTPVVFILLRFKPVYSRQKQAKPSRANQQQNAAGSDKSNDATKSPESSPVHPFLTTYRAAMMVVTCSSILAVDFPIFPRRFAKVENWGTSLMDLGVGSFVFSAGVVSARSILKARAAGTSQQSNLLWRLAAASRHSIPLLVLGLIRLYSVKGLDYAEHVTEYGVHWNFFFTLGFLPPFVEIFHSLYSIISSYELLALFTITVYQVALESTDLKAYILVSPRGPDLLSKNREGVFSFIGYLAIFLSGRATGLRIIPRGTANNKPSSAQQARKRVLISLAIMAVGWAVLFFFNSTPAFGYGARIPVSRRLANMPYVFWVSAFNNAQIFLFCLIETLLFPSVHKATEKETEAEKSNFATSRIMAAFNKNGLAVFLIANLLTGAVNLSFNTLDANAWQSLAILVAYMAFVTAFALGLQASGLKLKI
ncbi:GPI anchor biosynthesis protein Gwt1, putative [Talaromyces stipitatus ATCC 10500]|uniref:GPI-anchored wall transfer protein n=1 Tax=Talaromyces stipitatus (strain ATCC 10500 / CBS 375.48 / QM 6759 / NRRL 1006) TaxID=441959 RepID=B8M2W5_TALSN|nr:GPI anchor biosynthesis protein Gwt1, putative [Talaromyces stipitatus ATCC 10500]EED22220.1 GPI anchor biosynthesis protein Gwt1, putative [Talaromyces stipitatus ATCC 10500]